MSIGQSCRSVTSPFSIRVQGGGVKAVKIGPSPIGSQTPWTSVLAPGLNCLFSSRSSTTAAATENCAPGRKGYLVDPDRYPFLEGRPKGSKRDAYDKLDVPRVSDGVIFRVLNNLLIPDGERLSYRIKWQRVRCRR